jgi:hypothetical protein
MEKIVCKCGVPVKKKQCNNGGPNTGRYFYGCGNYGKKNSKSVKAITCNFFQWLQDKNLDKSEYQEEVKRGERCCRCYRTEDECFKNTDRCWQSINERCSRCERLQELDWEYRGSLIMNNKEVTSSDLEKSENLMEKEKSKIQEEKCRCDARFICRDCGPPEDDNGEWVYNS